MEQPTKPVDKSIETFEILRDVLFNAPVDTEYKLKMFDALKAYIESLKY